MVAGKNFHRVVSKMMLRHPPWYSSNSQSSVSTKSPILYTVILMFPISFQYINKFLQSFVLRLWHDFWILILKDTISTIYNYPEILMIAISERRMFFLQSFQVFFCRESGKHVRKCAFVFPGCWNMLCCLATCRGSFTL